MRTIRPAERRHQFERLFDEHLRTVYAYVLRRVRASEADDAVAEVFLIAWRRLEHVPVDAKPWLLGVARRVLANQRRSAGRRARLLARSRDAAPPTVREAAQPAPILLALARLSESDRELLLLVAWEGLSTDEAAAVVSCSRGAAKVRLHRARRRLREALDALEEDEVPRTSPWTLEEVR